MAAEEAKTVVEQEVKTTPETEKPVVLDKIHGKIEFSHVGFHKADMHEILSDISFCIEPGKTLGIMGATGAGKTSIIHLLQRLYDATDGAVYLDDVNQL